jgi:hypothetical protein
MEKKKNIKFLMDTDWMFEKPIDSEHKEYKLLSYFQKMGEKLDKLELYPSFIELSLHLANVQVLMQEKKIIYTNKKLTTIDDEIFVKDLKVKEIPQLSEEETKEFWKILSYSAPRIINFFSVVKDVWTMVYDSLDMKIRKNKKNITNDKGYFYFNNSNNNITYVWEYTINKGIKNVPDRMKIMDLIYSDKIDDLTIQKIITKFSSFESKDKRLGPIFEMTTSKDLPLNETLVPLFKRMILGLISQEKTIKNFNNGIE